MAEQNSSSSSPGGISNIVKEGWLFKRGESAENVSDHYHINKINVQGNTSRTGDRDTLSSRMMDSLSGSNPNPVLRISMTH